MMTAMGLPEDGEAITRRALEAAKTCLAIKLDSDNGDAWLAAEARVKRWQQRKQGQKPSHFYVEYKNLANEPLFRELNEEFGSLSDFSVHFTPEFFGRFIWEETQLPGGGSEHSFGLITGSIEMAFFMLSKHHELIIRVFDRCQDGKMLSHPEVRAALERVYVVHNHFHQLIKPTLDAMTPRATP